MFKQLFPWRNRKVAQSYLHVSLRVALIDDDQNTWTTALTHAFATAAEELHKQITGIRGVNFCAIDSTFIEVGFDTSAVDANTLMTAVKSVLVSATYRRDINFFPGLEGDDPVSRMYATSRQPRFDVNHPVYMGKTW